MRERTTDIKDIYNEQITPNDDVRQTILGACHNLGLFVHHLAHLHNLKILWSFLKSN